MALSDILEIDLGTFFNKIVNGFYDFALDLGKWIAKFCRFYSMLVVMIITATIDIIPFIWSSIQRIVGYIDGATLPDKPEMFPGADFLVFVNTFFPLKEFIACITLYYTILFTLFLVKAIALIVKFGIKATVKIIALAI